MKSRPNAHARTPATSTKPALAAQLEQAKRIAESTRKVAQGAKAEFKRVRKAYKQAKKAAKEAKKKFKALRNFIAEGKAARARVSAAKKPAAPAKVKAVKVIKPAKSKRPKRKAYIPPTDLSEALPATAARAETVSAAAIPSPSSTPPVLPLATPSGSF